MFNHTFSEGQFPVRWTGWIKEGYNQPLFNYYQVGFYYLVSFVHFFVPSFILAIKLSVLFLWWLGAFFVYLLCRRFGVLPALLGTLVFTFSPYLILDIFVRVSYPEFMAICFIPGILWAIDRLLILKKRLYLLPLAIFLGIAILSHLFVFDINSKTEDKLTINTHYFPGWKAYLNWIEVPINRVDKHSFMTIDIPSGQHELIVKFEDTILRKIANIITLISLIISGTLGLSSFKKKGFGGT